MGIEKKIRISLEKIDRLIQLTWPAYSPYPINNGATCCFNAIKNTASFLYHLGNTPIYLKKCPQEIEKTNNSSKNNLENYL